MEIKNNIKSDTPVLSIIYRCCPQEFLSYSRQDRPIWFSKKKCFISLINAIKRSKYNIKLYILMDSDGQDEFSKFIKNYNCEFYNQILNSNFLSLKWQLDFSKKIESDMIYFLEDDFLHLENSLNKLIEACYYLNLVTGYDHLDRYITTDDLTKDKEKIVLVNNYHWRSAESTTCTWMVNKKIYDICINVAENHLLNDREMFRDLIKNHNIRLFTPLPGLTTHCHKQFLSPVVDWQNFNLNLK